MSDQTESSHLTGVDMSGIIALFHALADEHGRDVAEMIPPDLLPAIEALVEAKVRRARAASRMAEPQTETTQRTGDPDDPSLRRCSRGHRLDSYSDWCEDCVGIATPSVVEGS